MTAPPSLFRTIIDLAFNQGRLAIVDELVSIESTTHIPGWGMPANRLGIKQMIATLRTAFPDLHCTIEDKIEADNKFAALWTMRGTHTGMFLGNRPTGKPVEVQGIIFAHIGNGQIIEHWLLLDQMTLLQQLGIVPP